jgi:hypothetical protein
MWRALPYLIAMFAVVPLVGLLAGGSWRASWQYTKTWLLCLAIVGAAGGVLTLILAT